MAIKKELVRMRLDQLTPYLRNPRRNEAAVRDVAESIEQCGDLDPIEIDEDGVILSGHTRLKALQRRGETETDVIRYTGLTEEQKRKYRLLTNKTGEKASWNKDLLAIEMDGLDFGGFDFGFDIDMDIETEDPAGLKPEAYMPICMAMIDAADAVVVLPEYDGENSAGTELEIKYAKYQHKAILHTAAELRFDRSCEEMTAK